MQARFKLLKREGEEHKRKRGIEANFTEESSPSSALQKEKEKEKEKEKNDDEGDLFLLDY